MKRVNRSQEEIEEICKFLLKEDFQDQGLEVTLDDFQKIYQTILHLTKQYPIVSLVNMGDRVVSQISNISPQHFHITQPVNLTNNDFEFINKKNWYGQNTKIDNFFVFLVKDLKANLIRLLPIAIIGFSIMYFINTESFYEVVSNFVIQCSTIFFGLYIIFTVSQSQSLYKDISLYVKGIWHKYYSDDRNIALLGILTIALAFLGYGIVILLSKLTIGDVVTTKYYTAIRFIRAGVITFDLVLLFDTFIAVADYYLQRPRDVAERDIVAEILEIDYEKYSKPE